MFAGGSWTGVCPAHEFEEAVFDAGADFGNPGIGDSRLPEEIFQAGGTPSSLKVTWTSSPKGHAVLVSGNFRRAVMSLNFSADRTL